MILNHYGTHPLGQVHNVEQNEDNRMGQIGKPSGLWLSDCTSHGWADWCISEGFRLDRLLVRTRCTLDTTDLVLIDDYVKMSSFNEQYGMPLYGDLSLSMTAIDWGAVSSKYKGIAITPYLWGCRLEPEYFWYYGWDCASACIWDVSCITSREIDPEWSHTVEELQEMHEKGYEDETDT